MKIKTISIRLIYIFFRLISQNRIIKKLFFNYIAPILKIFKDGKWKHQLLNVLKGTNWNFQNIKPCNVKVGSSVNLMLYPNFNEFDFEAILLNKLSYEEELYKFLDKIINKYDVVIDIGSNIGLFSLYAAKQLLQRNKPIFSFEPSSKAFLRLIKNRNINNLENIYCFNIAISDCTGFFNFYEPKEHLTNGSFNKNFAQIFDNNPAVNKVFAIDGCLIDQLGFTKGENILIKIDAEGHEAKILVQLKDFILKYKPDIICEVLPIYEDELNSIDFIKTYYEVYLISDNLIKYDIFVSNSSCRDYFLTPI